jgi:CubicO group peptidase (beta-lactamase class C family)
MLTATPAGPFSATVRKSVLKLMEKADLPQISIAVERGNDSYDYSLTNPKYTHFGFRPRPKTTEESLFRLASVSKVFTAVVIMKEVELGLLTLNENPFQILGFFNSNGTPIAQSGYDPVTGKPVTYSPASTLDTVTIQSLLNMSSGLPLNVPVRSSTFPTAKPAPVIYLQGDYAALGFAHQPPYSAPASDLQQLDYYVYSFSAHNLSLDNPGSYDYSDTGYALLGAVAEQISMEHFGLGYGDFLRNRAGRTPLRHAADRRGRRPAGRPRESVRRIGGRCVARAWQPPRGAAGSARLRTSALGPRIRLRNRRQGYALFPAMQLTWPGWQAGRRILRRCRRGRPRSGRPPLGPACGTASGAGVRRP